MATEIDVEAQVGAYAERIFGTMLAALEAFSLSLGRELGLYQHLETDGGLTAGELAGKAGVDVRYAREWLEQQATAGYIDVTAASDDAQARRFGLSAAAAECLLRPDSLASVGPLIEMLPSVTRVFPGKLTTAFRTGGGIPYADYAMHDAQGDFNRPAFLNLLASEWLPVFPGLVSRLSEPGARAAEIGCGEGWAAIALALAFPSLHVDGLDLDDASITAARKNATQAGVGHRVSFQVADVADLAPLPEGSYDLVMAMEMIHDLPRPVDALAAMLRLGSPSAIRLVMDEKVGEAFEASTDNPVERFMYAASVLHCLPVGRADPPSEATGTVMRPDTLRSYASAAGFSRVDIAPIDHDFFYFYSLVP